jgi:hypothetical protein
MMETSKISVVLTGYKRPYVLKEQIDAIKSQTIKPAEIIFCQNGSESFDLGDDSILEGITTIKCNKNLGVWARFSYALNCTSEYVCIFDDDTIPGSKWFENCVDTIYKFNGLLGTIGIQYHNKDDYFRHTKVGWGHPNSNTERVDIVGHCWFFKRAWLSYFWSELPRVTQSMRVGEDMHFAYTLQKYAKINCYVPPHPINDEEMWGSKPSKGHIYGRDENALSNEIECLNNMRDTYTYYISKGFRIISDNNNNTNNNIEQIKHIDHTHNNNNNNNNELDMLRADKDKFISVLWKLYLEKCWEKLYIYANMYISDFNSDNNYDLHLSTFFLAYAELELKKNDDCKKNYMKLLDNPLVSSDIKDWSFANITALTPVFSHGFVDDFDKLWSLIENGKNFAFARYGKSEYDIINNDNNINNYMSSTLTHTEDNYFYGVPNNTNDNNIDNYFKNNILQNRCKCTFNTIFYNCNYVQFLLKVCVITEDIVLISIPCEHKNYGKLKIVEYLCVNNYETNNYDIADLQKNVSECANKYNNTLFFIASGPLTPIIIDTLYKTNPDNRYVDIGCGLDEVILKKRTKPFMDPFNDLARFKPLWLN